MKHKDPDDPKEKPEKNDVRGDVVDGKSKFPDGQDSGKIAEYECSDRPKEPTVGQARTNNLV